MATIASVSIDLTKIDKSKIIEGKNGAKWFNLSITTNDEQDQYGNDVSITIGQTKEERERKDKRTYLGNGKIIWRNDGKEAKKPEPETPTDTVDDLPF